MSATIPRSRVCAARAAALGGFVALMAACHPGPPPRAEVPREAPPTTPPPRDTTPAPPAERLGGVRVADRDSLVREAQDRRTAWRARGITDYRVRIAMQCFCPMSPPVFLEVRGGVPVAVRDSIGRPAGQTREAYAYTIEGLFDLVERTARNGELVAVSYAPSLGYPASVSVDPKGLDNWYRVTADHLTTPR